MSYEIKKVEIEDTTIITEVEFTLKDGSTEIVSIPHFQPETIHDVIVGIENREFCENKDLEIPTILENVKKDLEKLIA
jgi:hypothetical protein